MATVTRRPDDEYGPASKRAIQVAIWQRQPLDQRQLGQFFGITAHQAGYLIAIRERLIKEETEGEW